jgi:hypothetical protein
MICAISKLHFIDFINRRGCAMLSDIECRKAPSRKKIYSLRTVRYHQKNRGEEGA